MNMLKKMFIVVLTVVVSVSGITAYAEEEMVFADALELEEVIDNDEIQQEIENYLNSKTLPTTTVMSRNSSVEEPLERNAQLRAEGFQEFEARVDVNFKEVSVTSHIEDIVEQNSNSLTLKVYEWTNISYSASNDTECIDVMGYGTEHIMTFEVENGSYELVDDSFDERSITGVCSADILEQEEQFSVEEGVNEVAINALSDSTYSIKSANYDVDAAIAYANQWCGIPASDRNYVNGSTTNDSTDYYNNNEYTPNPGADCANFVSQCLYAGGLPTDSTWYAGTVAWVRASGLRDYLVNCGYTSVLANSNNIYPGNPVYWINGEDGNASSSSSGHQMICTGYNSSGVAVLNAHSNNAYRIPYTNYGKTLRTILIANGNEHQHSNYEYRCNAINHWRICGVCEYRVSVGTHQIVTSGLTQYCSVCGYTGPFASTTSIVAMEE